MEEQASPKGSLSEGAVSDSIRVTPLCGGADSRRALPAALPEIAKGVFLCVKLTEGVFVPRGQA